MSLLLCLLAYLVVHPATLLVFSVPVVVPPRNQYVASNSMDVLNYSCTVDNENKAIWEVRGIQYSSQSQLTQQSSSSGIGLMIVPMDLNSRVSMISISNVTRGNLSLQCVAIPSQFGSRADKGVEYFVVSFDQPSAVENLRLVPSNGDLILSWKRPDNVPSEVEILYTLLINNTNTTMLTSSQQLNITTFSLRDLEAQVLNDSAVGLCVMFEFTVNGRNEAGVGPPNTIVDTIPISPDVTLISTELRVERVDLQPFSVHISFPPVNPCSINFPLHNYTIKVDDRMVFVLFADDVASFEEGERISLNLNSTILSGVALDDSFPLTVTACNDITCRTSEPVTLNTTDVQGVEAIYFRNRLFLRCSFADNSRARGCAVRLSLADSNDTEIYEFLHDSDVLPCFETDYRLDAYSEVVVIDIEEDGMLGNGNLTVVPEEETSEDMYIQITGCPAVSKRVDGLSSSAAAIVGGVLGPFLAISVATIIVVIIVIILVVKKKQRPSAASRAATTVRSDGVEYEIIQTATESQAPSQDTKGGPPPPPMASPSEVTSIGIRAGPPPPPASPEDESGLELSRIQADDSTPLLEIEGGCSYDSSTEMIVINIQLVAKTLGIEQSQIRRLKMQQK